GQTTSLQITGALTSNGGNGDINIALLILLGVTSIAVYGVALAGWSSNSKYSLLGSLRASAQMVSYELSLGLSLVGVLILAGSFSLRQIVDKQAGGILHLFIWPQVISFFIYPVFSYAGATRHSFDLPEAETALHAGYHSRLNG